MIGLLQGLDLPTDLHFDAEKIYTAVRHDKKKLGDRLFFVFLDGIGSARVEKFISLNSMPLFKTIFHPDPTRKDP